MTYYLGIDGGGTKTRCALGDETSLLTTSAAGGSNVIRLGEAKAREALLAAVRDVCSTVNIFPDQLRSICVGAAGAGRQDVAATIRKILGEFTPAPVHVVGDMVIALEAAFGSGPGVIAIAGTGSIAYGRDPAGNIARAGGWGFAISDEGSGQWIGRKAVTAILHAHDAGTSTALTELVLKEWSLHSLDDLVHAANATPPPEFPRLFPLVLQAAVAGDRAAADLLEEAGKRLADLAAMVILRIGPHPPHAPVAMTGSVFRQSTHIVRIFYNCLQERFPGLEVRNDPVEPVDGALALARKMAPAGTG
ncbi:MAG TPA: BadF/BadG/BcrA/BcrD ATPase family protein [Terriglobales bacterium]|nr:BadF/BadG/BcrA/BcrD ATPase family protein [Terriglobales bacterium]